MPKKSLSWIDVTVALWEGMVPWPDNSSLRITRTQDLEGGVDCRGMDAMPLSVSLGLSRVIAARDTESIKPDELGEHRMQRGERILFKSCNSPRCCRALLRPLGN